MYADHTPDRAMRLMAHLEYNDGESDRRVPIASEEFVIGRLPSSGLELNCETVSRRHARIRRQADTLLLEDLESLNGTTLNGMRIDGPTRLRDGNVIGVGRWRLTLRLKAPAHSTLSAGRVRLVPGTSAEQSILSTLDASAMSRTVCSVRPEIALRAVLDVTGQLGRRIDVDELLPRVLDRLFDLYPQADHGVILLVDRDSGELEPKAVRSRHTDSNEVCVSRTVISRAMQQRQAILSADAVKDTAFEASKTLPGLSIRSLMVVPLMSQTNEPLGVVELHTETESGRFTPN